MHMITVNFWSEKEQAYSCVWEQGGRVVSGYLTEAQLEEEERLGEEIQWECSP